jgi:putative transcriptional regulator
MDRSRHKTDEGVLAAIGAGLARRRLELNQTQAQLAHEAGISRRTLSRLEGGESTQLTNLVRVVRALGWMEKLDALSPPRTVSPLEQLREQTKERKRATGQATSETQAEGWTWDDPDDGGENA